MHVFCKVHLKQYSLSDKQLSLHCMVCQLIFAIMVKAEAVVPASSNKTHFTNKKNYLF